MLVDWIFQLVLFACILLVEFVADLMTLTNVYKKKYIYISGRVGPYV